ncbi:MAG: rhodanese-like domain-containing protein [Calditrichae bacterium]|nr:rhodanese-like domain-containing protein [Calditrichia bacterium]
MKLSSKMLGFATLLLLAVILSFAPVDQVAVKPFSEEELVHQLNNKSNYVQADQLAHMIIDKEPGFQVIDIRPKEDYQKYHIPGSVNIPLDELFNNKGNELIIPSYMKILVSNGNTKAGQAWLLMRSKGYNETYVLHGGMNYWVGVFTNPEKPADIAADDEFFTYQFRKSAGPVMMGTESIVQNTEVETSVPKAVIRKRPARKKGDEGC